MKFQLVDRVVSWTPGESIRAVKNLSLAEEYLQDHFPGFPVFPGVLMVEAMVQTSAWLLRASNDFTYSMTLLQQAKAVKFNSFVKPGRSLHLEAKIVKTDDATVTLKTTGHLNAFADEGGESAVSARLVLEQSNLDSEETTKDDRLRELLRRDWTTIAGNLAAAAS